jgi:putative two-component system response regulator
VAGRIVAVADTLDALTSDRPYRPAFTLERALEILRSLAGSKLDPHMVEVLVEALDEQAPVTSERSGGARPRPWLPAPPRDVPERQRRTIRA